MKNTVSIARELVFSIALESIICLFHCFNERIVSSQHSVHRPFEVELNPWYRRIAFAALLALFILCILWELWLDPMVPGGSIYVLKALPLMYPLYGVYKGNLYTMQWSSMLVLLYVFEGSSRLFADTTLMSQRLGMIELLLALIVFVACILYVRPAKKLAKQIKKQGL